MADVVELRGAKVVPPGDMVRREVGSWPGVGMGPGPNPGSTEFRFHHRVMGHLHAAWNGVALVDLIFSPEAGEALIAAGRAERHPMIPGMGWVSVQVRTAADAVRVIALFRENYDRLGGRLHVV